MAESPLKGTEKHRGEPWQEKVAKAKEAREQGQAARQGKAQAFRTRRLTGHLTP